MSAILDCANCGLPFDADSDAGCWVCVTCADCTPAAGRCLDCRDMRAEDLADQTRRYALENEVTC